MERRNLSFELLKQQRKKEKIGCVHIVTFLCKFGLDTGTY